VTGGVANDRGLSLATLNRLPQSFEAAGQLRHTLTKNG